MVISLIQEINIETVEIGDKKMKANCEDCRKCGETTCGNDLSGKLLCFEPKTATEHDMIIKVEKIKEQPENLMIVYVEAVLMPNGEIIHSGETIGWYKNCKDYMFTVIE